MHLGSLVNYWGNLILRPAWYSPRCVRKAQARQARWTVSPGCGSHIHSNFFACNRSEFSFTNGNPNLCTKEQSQTATEEGITKRKHTRETPPDPSKAAERCFYSKLPPSPVVVTGTNNYLLPGHPPISRTLRVTLCVPSSPTRIFKTSPYEHRCSSWWPNTPSWSCLTWCQLRLY